MPDKRTKFSSLDLLEYIDSNPHYTYTDIANEFNVNVTTARRRILTMIKNGIFHDYNKEELKRKIALYRKTMEENFTVRKDTAAGKLLLEMAEFHVPNKKLEVTGDKLVEINITKSYALPLTDERGDNDSKKESSGEDTTEEDDS